MTGVKVHAGHGGFPTITTEFVGCDDTADDYVVCRIVFDDDTNGAYTAGIIVPRWVYNDPTALERAFDLADLDAHVGDVARDLTCEAFAA